MEVPVTPPGGPTHGSVASTADLLQRARHGDTDALNELFSRYLPSLQRWARGRLPRWTRDVRDTDDVVQETLIPDPQTPQVIRGLGTKGHYRPICVKR